MYFCYLHFDFFLALARPLKHTKLNSSPRLIMGPVPVSILDEFSRRKKKVCPSSSQTGYASYIFRPVFTLDGLT